MENARKTALHYGVAERGKLYCLSGNYKEALRHLREALKLAMNQKSADIFFQHYSQCVMECLELSGAHDEVISYCEKVIEFLRDKPEQTDFVKRSLGIVLEKQGIQFLFKEEKEDAIASFKEVQSLLGKKAQPLTDQLLDWLLRGYRITKDQVQNIQKKHNYFIIRKEKVRPELAVDLPKVASSF